MDIDPIVLLRKNEDIHNDSVLMADYYKTAFAATLADSVKNGDTTVLLNFALTDYFAADASFYRSRSLFASPVDNRAYVFSQTVFYDFNVIEVTFDRDGVFTVIPVVSNPIDIVFGVTPPPERPRPNITQWLRDLLDRIGNFFSIVLMVLGVLILILVVVYFFRFVGWLAGGNRRRN